LESWITDDIEKKGGRKLRLRTCAKLEILFVLNWGSYTTCGGFRGEEL